MNPILSVIIDTADAADCTPGDYISPADGLKYCGKCHTPKEAFFPDGMSFNGSNKHPAHCECAAKALANGSMGCLLCIRKTSIARFSTIVTTYCLVFGLTGSTSFIFSAIFTKA